MDTINGVPFSTYNAKLLTFNVQAATITTYTDWIRNAANPTYYGTQESYIPITLTLLIEDTDDDHCMDDIRALIGELKNCTLKADKYKYLYDAVLSETPTNTRLKEGYFSLEAKVNAGYAYLPTVTVDLTSQSQVLTAPGNLKSAAVITLTPTQDIGSVTISGLSAKPIKVSNLHAGAPVRIDGEKYVVTEPDLDVIMTETMGAGKWMFRRYQIPQYYSPDDVRGSGQPTPDLIPVNSAYTQKLLANAQDIIYERNIYNYMGHIKAGLHVDSAKTINVKFKHDDGVYVALNGSMIYESDHVEDFARTPFSDIPEYPTIALGLRAGWNRLEFLWMNHFGPGGIWGIIPAFTTANINAYYARDASPSGTVNKFPDADLSSWPEVQPGAQTITTDTLLATCGVKIEYKPKFR